jgi:hypothetical protein
MMINWYVIDMNNLSKDVRELLPRTLSEVLSETTEKDDRLKIYNHRYHQVHGITVSELCSICQAIKAAAQE